MLIEGKTKLNSIADAERCDNFKLQMNFMFFLHLSVAVACPVGRGPKMKNGPIDKILRIQLGLYIRKPGKKIGP